MIDKEFASASIIDTDGTAFEASSNISGYEIYAIYGGHSIRLRLSFTPKAALDSDSTVDIGSFVFANMGVTGLYNSIISIPALSDGANGLVMANISNNGQVIVNDIVKSTIANQALYINENITCKCGNMLNAFCDKFYWKRIS